MMPKCKCKDCTRRVVGCHSRCEDYIRFKAETMVLNKRIHEDQQVGRDISLSIINKEKCEKWNKSYYSHKKHPL